MREKTDLEGVKFVAKQLVMIDIHLTEYSPIVVQHPFTSSGIAAAPSKDGLRLLDITKSEEDLRAWQGYNGTGKEHYGFASSKDVADFESGREDEIYEYVSIETYKKMDDELKKAYQYYEWNDRTGVYHYYSILRQEVEKQLRIWKCHNVESIEDIRLIMFIN